MTSSKNKKASFFDLSWKIAAYLLITMCVVWLGGLFWFASALDDSSGNSSVPTDAIIVLTGGSGRLEFGLKLLAEGRGKKLFISGVHRGVEVTELVDPNPKFSAWIACCVVLGHQAENTVGNAVETKQWLAKENFHSLRLVTANYHMRRSLLEFHRVLRPQTVIVPEPVFQPGAEKKPWWLWRSGERVVVTEYLKYLAAWLRPYWSRFFADQGMQRV